MGQALCGARKVLFLAPRLFSEGSSGGGERYTSLLLRSLCEYDALSIRAIVGESYRSLVEIDPALMIEKPCTLGSLSQAIMESDIVHIHQLNSHIADLALGLSIPSRARVVLTDHGGGWRSIGRLAGRQRFRFVSGLAAVSQTSATNLGWPKTKPLKVLYGGGDHLPRVHAREGDKRYDFLYVGRILPHKGVHLLLRALPVGSSCLIVGAPMIESYLQELRSMATGRDVQFNLGVKDDEVARAYALSKWCVSPTLSRLNGKHIARPELLGITPIESVTAGTPVVLSDIPAYRELAPFVGARLFPAGSLDELHRVLLRCMEESEKSVPPSGVMTTFAWRAVAERVFDLYQRLL